MKHANVQKLTKESQRVVKQAVYGGREKRVPRWNKVDPDQSEIELDKQANM